MYNNISLDTYNIFKEVYENGNLTKTAEKMHIAQPSISYRIKLLEENLNVKLFSRTASGMVPTLCADKLYHDIKSALDTIKFAERNITEENMNSIGDIYIGVQHHIGKYYLTKAIKKYNELFPNVRIHVINKGTEALIDLLEQGKLDIIVDTLPINGKTMPINVKEIKTFHTCFAKIKSAPNKYILPVIGSNMRTEIERLLQAEGIKLEPTYEIYTTEMTIEMLRESMGIAYTIKEFLLHERIENIEFVNVLEKMPELVLCFATVEDKQSYNVKNFIELLENKENEYIY